MPEVTFELKIEDEEDRENVIKALSVNGYPAWITTKKTKTSGGPLGCFYRSEYYVNFMPQRKLEDQGDESSGR